MHARIISSLCAPSASNCVSLGVCCSYTESLAEFIAYHTVDKLCLPCKLVLPKPGGGGGGSVRGRGGGEGVEGTSSSSGAGAGGAHQVRRRPVTMQEALKTGAGYILDTVREYCGLGSMAIHLSHRCFSSNMR